MKRRRLLGFLGVSACSVSGCLGAEMPTDAVVKAVPVSRPNVDATVRYSTLPERERETAQTAVEDGFYHACPELPDAVQSFANRF